jgi:hypothetical protein
MVDGIQGKVKGEPLCKLCRAPGPSKESIHIGSSHGKSVIEGEYRVMPDGF